MTPWKQNTNNNNNNNNNIIRYVQLTGEIPPLPETYIPRVTVVVDESLWKLVERLPNLWDVVYGRAHGGRPGHSSTENKQINLCIIYTCPATITYIIRIYYCWESGAIFKSIISAL